MKVTVTTIITQQLAYDRCDEFVKVKTFDESEPISKIKDWVEYLKTILGLGRSHGEGNGNPPQYSCLENLMDGAVW